MQERREMMSLGLRWSTVKAMRLGIVVLYLSLYRSQAELRVWLRDPTRLVACGSLVRRGSVRERVATSRQTKDLRLVQERSAVESGEESSRKRKESD